MIEEPFGSGMALILVGMFFAQKLYKLNILTIGDYYRERYGRGVEVLCTLFIVLSYLGWVGAQVAALGLVINLITEGYISVSGGMVIGTVVVLAYTMYGGMWSVAVTDFVQMIIIVLGLVAILFFASDLAGGFGKVIDYAHERDLFNALPEPTATGWLFWISSAITMMIGSIPQQDVFQRVMSARNVQTAVAGPVIGGCVYILFAFVPMFIVIAAILVMPGSAQDMLRAMRWTVFGFAIMVLSYSLFVEGTAIYDMVAMAYQFPVIGAFWPLVCGLYWKRTTRQGVWWSMLLGAGVWTVLTTTAFGDVFPNVLGGFLAAGFGMVAGSLAPTRGNREYLAWWHEKNRDNVVNEPLMPKPAVVPISSLA